MPRRIVRLAKRRVAGAADEAMHAADRVRQTATHAMEATVGRARPAKRKRGSKFMARLLGRKPPPKDRAKAVKAKKGQAGKAKPRHKAHPAGSLGVLDAVGFFIAAGLILAHAKPGARAAALAAAREPNRGREAEHPLQIPPRGWADILRRTWTNFNNDRIMATAGGVTFFTLLAIFPALAAFVSLYGLFFDRHDIAQQLNLMSGFVPHDVLTLFADQTTRIASTGSGKLGVAFAVSLLLSLWSGNGAIRSLFDGLNVAYEEKERRSFLRMTLVTLGFTAGAIVFALIAVGAVVVLPVVLTFLHLDAKAGWIAVIRWPIILLIVAFALSVVYRYGPSRAQPRWRWITPGGGLAAVLWLAASLAFSWYVSNFANFNKTYGSLGAVVGFMTWLWYSTIIVLFGAELNAEIEHQTVKDTTVGGPRPFGTRGAAMADTVGEAR